LPVAKIAFEAGYESEAAFKRALGVPQAIWPEQSAHHMRARPEEMRSRHAASYPALHAFVQARIVILPQRHVETMRRLACTALDRQGAVLEPRPRAC